MQILICLSLIPFGDAPAAPENVKKDGKTLSTNPQPNDIAGLVRIIRIPKDAKQTVYGDAAPRVGPLPGTPVYRNDTPLPPAFAAAPLGLDVTLMDDLTLDGGATEITHYDLVVTSETDGDPTFDVHVELWNGDPCLPASSVLAGTGKDWLGIPADSALVTLTHTLAVPVSAPATVWMAVTFSSFPGATRGAWVIAEEAELGFTTDTYSFDFPGAGCFSGQPLGAAYAGFYASLRGGPCGNPVCGDGTCCPTENACSCPNDCPDDCSDNCCTGTENECNCPQNCGVVCGDGCCSSTETPCACSADCTPICGDDCCTGTETLASCPQDCDCDIPPGDDCFTIPVGGTAINFTDIPIPGKVFGSGSLPYDKVIRLFGSKDKAFTLQWNRPALANACTGNASPIQLVGDIVLNSVNPILTLTAGAPPRGWIVEATLRQAASPPSTISINRTGAEGGTVVVDLYLDAQLKFTLIDPGDPVFGNFDLAVAGIEPFHVRSVGPVSFVDTWIQAPAGMPCDANFVPGVHEDPVSGDQCCERILLAGPGIHLELLPPGCVATCAAGACCITNIPNQASQCDNTITESACNALDDPLDPNDPVGTWQPTWPNCDDQDGDGLADWLETPTRGPQPDCHTGTNPLDPNTDGDGADGSLCNDAQEIANGLDPLNPCDCGAPPVQPDCNGNGRADRCDIACVATNTCGGIPGSEDCDGDRIPNECDGGVCCTISISGFDSCLEISKAECDAITPPGTFLPCEDKCWSVNARTARHNGVLIVHSVGRDVDCPGGPVARSVVTCTPGAPLIDPWVSVENDPANPVVCHDFGFGLDECGPISGGFFGPLSDIFDGRVCLQGVPLGSPFGKADTLVERSADPFDRCAIIPLPSTADPVAVQITGLSLESKDPIVVTFNGGQNPEQWDLAVSLSPGDQPVGTLTATKDHCNGGTYFTNAFGVYPLFTFTRRVPPFDVLTLDTRKVGCAAVFLDIDELAPAPWVHDVAPNSGIVIDPCSDFHPAIEEGAPTQACDCNGNAIRDVCDIEDGVSQDCNGDGIPDDCQLAGNDCNGNGIPDDCETDCNGNGVPDDCDIDPTDPDGNGLVSADCDGANGNGAPDECEFDCNANSVADSCDIARLNSDDVDGNGVPDECQDELTVQCCVPGGLCVMATTDGCLASGGTPGVQGSICSCGDGCCAGTETFCNCPQDCPTACGDGCCTSPGESACNCLADCPDVCGDGCCTGAETFCDCPQDCLPACGDGCCTSPDEDACNCLADCSDVCGDRCCTGTETVFSCPQDCDCDIAPGRDCFAIPNSAGNLSINFRTFPIPGDTFGFGPGALPFNGIVQLRNASAQLASLKWDRTALANACTGDPIPLQLQADIVLNEVNAFLVRDENNFPQFWKMTVILSPAPSSPGTMSINRTHDNGGTFTAEIFVNAVLRLSPSVQPPAPAAPVIKSFDLSATGFGPIRLRTVGPISFVDTWNQVPAGTPCDANFVPAVQEDPLTGTQCCETFLMTGEGLYLELRQSGCIDACATGACCITNIPDQAPQCDDTIGEGLCPAPNDPTGPLDPVKRWQPTWPNCDDTDGDGLANWAETVRSRFAPEDCHTETDPNDADTDNDGCPDGTDLDPLDPCVPSGGCPGQNDYENCNGNGESDACDILSPLFDCDNNGIIDDCPPDLNTIVGVCCNGALGCGDVGTKPECEAAGFAWSGACLKCPLSGGKQEILRGVVCRHFPNAAGPLCVCSPSPGCFSRAACLPGDKLDAWQTDPGQDMCHQFGVDPVDCPMDCVGGNCSPPIPADFFGAGSDPFQASVCLEGVPLGGIFGDADTVVKRSADPFDRCALPSPTEVVVDLDAVALSLKSIDPIMVTFNGGQNPELWDVTVSLSDVPAPTGSLTAIKNHCNGGTYTSKLFIQPKFTFARQGGGKIVVLDTGLAGTCAVTLTQAGVDTEEWVHDVDPGLPIFSPNCMQFHPAISDLDPQPACDCNANLTRDACDIEQGASLDCNGDGIPDECQLAGNDCNNNGIPDECEDDCNLNGVPDDCDIDPTDPDGNGLVSADCDGANGNGAPDECENDCNANGVADSCDIARGSSNDVDGNGVPDECQDVLSGRCCVLGGACLVVPEKECIATGGVYGGDATGCAGDGDGNGDDDACPGTCCRDVDNDMHPETCQSDTRGLDCTAPGDRFVKAGAVCSGIIGACCLDWDGDGHHDLCVDGMAEECCMIQGGWFTPGGSCSGIIGACCLDLDGDGHHDTCTDGVNQDCCQLEGGWFTPDVTCSGIIGACCLDADGDGTLDACREIDEDCCTAENGTFLGVGSVCAGDGDGDGVDDTCAIEPPIRAEAPHDILKNRYISIDPRGATGNNPSSLHIRVMVDSSLVNGQLGNGPWWADHPDAKCVSVVTQTKPASEPDWSLCSTVHLTGCPIIPTTTYAIATESGGVLSPNELLDTQARPGVKWHGDCVGFFDGNAGMWTAPNNTTNIDDAVAAIKTFQDPNAFNATHVSVTDVQPNLNGSQINVIVNIGDVFSILLGFQGQEYPGPDLTQCP